MILKQFKYIETQTFTILLKIIIDTYQHFIYTFYAHWVKQNNSTTHKFMIKQLLIKRATLSYIKYILS